MYPRPRYLTIALVGLIAVELGGPAAVNDDRDQPQGKLRW